jgi:hypothetical protein
MLGASGCAKGAWLVVDGALVQLADGLPGQAARVLAD